MRSLIRAKVAVMSAAVFTLSCGFTLQAYATVSVAMPWPACATEDPDGPDGPIDPVSDWGPGGDNANPEDSQEQNIADCQAECQRCRPSEGREDCMDCCDNYNGGSPTPAHCSGSASGN